MLNKAYILKFENEFIEDVSQSLLIPSSIALNYIIDLKFKFLNF